MALAGEGVQVPSGAGQAGPAPETAPHVTSKSFDFPGPVPLRRSYIVASTPRSGSTFLCSALWQTGVLGAPSEYWNCRKRASPKTIGTRMMERLEASSGADYLTKLLACRTSRNGVFGLKVHFSHFEEVFNGFPQVLDLLAPVNFIYIERQDKLAQAVSMARSLQTGVWAFGKNRQRPAISYDRDLISRCLESLETQRRGWLQWFETNRIEPHVVTYEKLVADSSGVVSGIVNLLDVGNDAPHEVQQRKLARQSDGTNKEWADRYRSEMGADLERSEVDRAIGNGSAVAASAAPQAPADQDSAAERPAASSFFDRYERIKNAEANANRSRLGVFAMKRRRERYEAIIARNRELFHDAHVLDIQCGGGYFSLAALDAGARFVVGLESRRKPLESAQENFEKFGIDPESYRLVRGKVQARLGAFAPGEFDLIMCQDWLSDLHFFFQQLHRLKPKHVIFDMAITARKRPVVMFKTTTFKIKGQDTPSPDAKRRRSAFIAAVPNHPIIKMMCEHFGFRCRYIDWRALGITNWVGIGDYEHDRRRTYVLDRIR
jgi:trehalose 2-sulfotransferase